MAIKTDRLGKTKMMSCGMEATIIRYGGATDIDVYFEDGTVVKHKTYRAFKKGYIAHPNTKDRLGEAREMKCKMEATIIRYGSATDIDVRFKDGAIAKHKTYGLFKEGGIANPNMKISAEDRLGETRMMNCGMEATIIRYNTNKDIDVRFEDEIVVEHKGYSAFKRGEIANPNIKASAENRLGETKMMNCGMEAAIIRYGRCDDIDVRFEDGAVVEHRRYAQFKGGSIANPNVKIANPNIKASAKNRLGETRMMNCGMEATIIRYGKYTDIDVRFEDGAMVKHKAYSAFKKGEIANPNIKAFAKNRLGETRMMNCGMEATIIRYGGVRDIDVCFKDGTVAEHKVYNAFEKGNIAHPSTTAKARLGETRMMKCGMEATIIRYNRCDNINVRFEDGAVVKHRKYREFKKGEIANPNIKASRLGKTRMMNCGMETTIIRYNTAKDIDIRFEDGTVVEHRTYNSFKNGTIAHPLIRLGCDSKNFHGFICKQGFKDKDRVLYKCICKHCGLEDVLTPQEMIEHEKLEHGKNE